MKRIGYYFLAGLALVTFFSVAYFEAQDEPPPDISDLIARAENPAIPGETDFLSSLQKCTAFFSPTAAPDSPWKKHGDALMNFSAKRQYDEHELNTLLAECDTAGVWNELENALNAPARRRQFKADESTADTVCNLSLTLAAKLRTALDAGDYANAEKWFSLLMRLAKKYEDSSTAIMPYLISQTSRRQAVTEIRDHLKDKIPTASLRRLIEIIHKNRSLPENAREAVRGDFRFTYGDLKKNFDLSEDSTAWPGRRFYLKLVLKPNETTRRLAEITRDNIAATEKNAVQLTKDIARIPDLREKHGIRRKNIYSGNSAGLALANLATGDFRKIFSDVFVDRTGESLLIAALAVRAYENDYGALPATLDTLVPEYLSAVPTAFSDGKPVRYSKEKRVIWGVDETGADPDFAAAGAEKNSLIIRLPAECVVDSKEVFLRRR